MLHLYAYVQIQYRNRVQRFIGGAADARRVQQQVLLDKLRRYAESDFGGQHRFSEIRSVEDFRRNLPISKYEDYLPFIERVKNGDLQAMFGRDTEVLMFAMTSGTTGRAKYIPITNQFFQEYRRGWQIWGIQTYRDHLDLLSKKSLQLSSQWRQSFTAGGIPCGNISGLAAETTPRIGRGLFMLPPDLLRIKDTEAKLYATLRLALMTPNVGIAMTANPSTLIELARRMDRHRDHLVRDLFDGSLSTEFDVPGEIRESLKRLTGRSRIARARELEQQIEASDRLYPREAWPGLSLLAVWTGGSVGVYLPQLRDYFGDLPVRDHGLSASEGRMTVPLYDGTSGGLLDYQHHFFEFIPEDQYGQPNPDVLLCHELEPDKAYYILLTTSSGLYRYDIGDVVRCQHMQGQAPVLEFVNKGAHYSSVTGEKLSEMQVISAVKDSMHEMFLPVGEFTLAPKMNGDYPGYQLLIELDLPADKLTQLADLVEQRLVQANYEYGDKRSSGRLTPVQIRTLPPGTWQNFRRGRIRSRGSFEQYKHPFLVGDLEFADRLISQSVGHI